MQFAPHTLPVLATAAAAAVALAPQAALADGDIGDVAVRLDGSQLETSLVADADGDNNSFNGPAERVFVADLDEFETGDDGDVFSDTPPGVDGSSDFVTNTPGFDSDEGTFAAGTLIGLDVVGSSPLTGDNFTRYDPASDSLVSTTAELQVSFGNQLRRTDGSFGDDALLLPAFANGSWHRHYVFAVYGGLDNQTGDLQAPSAGVYVLEATLDSPALDGSDPLFFVFGVQSPEEEIDAAVAFLESSVVPEPATATALAAAAGTLLLRRRR